MPDGYRVGRYRHLQSRRSWAWVLIVAGVLFFLFGLTDVARWTGLVLILLGVAFGVIGYHLRRGGRPADLGRDDASALSAEYSQPPHPGRTEKSISCVHCGGYMTIGSAICPHCGGRIR